MIDVMRWSVRYDSKSGNDPLNYKILYAHEIYYFGRIFTVRRLNYTEYIINNSVIILAKNSIRKHFSSYYYCRVNRVLSALEQYIPVRKSVIFQRMSNAHSQTSLKLLGYSNILYFAYCEKGLSTYVTKCDRIQAGDR